jgi:hypothetical protein
MIGETADAHLTALLILACLLVANRRHESVCVFLLVPSLSFDLLPCNLSLVRLVPIQALLEVFQQVLVLLMQLDFFIELGYLTGQLGFFLLPVIDGQQ